MGARARSGEAGAGQDRFPPEGADAVCRKVHPAEGVGVMEDDGTHEVGLRPGEGTEGKPRGLHRREVLQPPDPPLEAIRRDQLSLREAHDAGTNLALPTDHGDTGTPESGAIDPVPRSQGRAQIVSQEGQCPQQLQPPGITRFLGQEPDDQGFRLAVSFLDEAERCPLGQERRMSRAVRQRLRENGVRHLQLPALHRSTHRCGPLVTAPEGGGRREHGRGPFVSAPGGRRAHAEREPSQGQPPETDGSGEAQRRNPIRSGG